MAGIYFHIPFCKQKCSYCDFHFSTQFQSYRQQMIDAMCREIELQQAFLKQKTIKTIYFGGGTPSLLTAKELEQLFKQLQLFFNLQDVEEITLEANPDDITLEQVYVWKKFNINRLSIGIQSFKNSDLTWMNRAHNTNDAENCVKIAQQAGIDNITVDLMYGLPNLSNEEWEKHLDRVIEMGVNHLSAYCLTVEQKTALFHQVQKGELIPANDQKQAEQFLILQKRLIKNGFEQYEISNFCKPNYESKHNSNYWNGVPYLGIGPSAHSFNGLARSWNVSNNSKYINCLESDLTWFESEFLQATDLFNELLLTGLRTSNGVCLEELYSRATPDQDFLDTLNSYVEQGLIVKATNSFYLSQEGRLFADKIASDLFLV